MTKLAHNIGALTLAGSRAQLPKYIIKRTAHTSAGHRQPRKTILLHTKVLQNANTFKSIATHILPTYLELAGMF